MRKTRQKLVSNAFFTVKMCRFKVAKNTALINYFDTLKLQSLCFFFTIKSFKNSTRLITLRKSTRQISVGKENKKKLEKYIFQIVELSAQFRERYKS